MDSDEANGPGSRSEPMDMDEPTISSSCRTDRSRGLVVVEVRWERKSGNDWLLRRVFDLLLRDPDLTDRDKPLRMEAEVAEDKEGGKT